MPRAAEPRRTGRGACQHGIVNDKEQGRLLRGTSMLIMRGEGRTNTDIGKIYGVGESQVSGIIRRTVKALGANDVAHALAIMLVTDPALLDHFRQELAIPERTRQMLQEL